MTSIAKIAGLYRFPVKGLSAEPLDRVALQVDRPLPGDRAIALEFRDSGIDPDHPEFRKKSYFLQLALFPALAVLKSRFDPETGRLEVTRSGAPFAEGVISDAADRERIETAFQNFFEPPLPRQPRLIAGGDVQFTDQSGPLISLINLATVNAIADVAGGPLDPVRFRGNLTLDGMEAWAENDLVGKRIRVGDRAVLEVEKRIDRCAATEVDLETGERNRPVIARLRETFGHIDCGVFARVVEPGAIAPGDALKVL
ncbi:MOSC domain-containing protein [Rhodobium gokarnense]|uniref:Uncharacterized protein YcbX n=1 Tax=Rhodobium gokarnense TaxID=364296 RepID=A0ABT3H8R1_9HYPH|nr:MOSC domain-containing protein [Rhodobium gokarnense]MCW2306785.1 uncharacterized protein YcbX [Rhodobium gokarnense]